MNVCCKVSKSEHFQKLMKKYTKQIVFFCAQHFQNVIASTVSQLTVITGDNDHFTPLHNTKVLQQTFHISSVTEKIKKKNSVAMLFEWNSYSIYNIAYILKRSSNMLVFLYMQRV